MITFRQVATQLEICISIIWTNNHNKIVSKMKNTESFMIGMKSKDSIKLDIVKLDKLEKYPEGNALPKNGLYRYLY